MKKICNKVAFSLLFVVSSVASVSARNSLAKTPPMGWMSWELFRCDVDCEKDPDMCISENLYRAQADELKRGGYVDAGYVGVHMDDCWPQKYPPRDPKTGTLKMHIDGVKIVQRRRGSFMRSLTSRLGKVFSSSFTQRRKSKK